MFGDKLSNEQSSTEYMMRSYYRSKSYNSQLLLDDPLLSSNPTSETYTNDKRRPNN